MTDKQKSVVNYLNTVESAHIYEIYTNTNLNFYTNIGKHTTALLSKMVKQGYINRVKKGHYSINENYKKALRTVNNYDVITTNNEVQNER
jgi:predicted transcriptional regulator of viral defense system